MRNWALLSVFLVACRGTDDDEARRRSDFMKSYVTAQDGGALFNLTLNGDVHFGAGFCPPEVAHEGQRFTSAFRRIAHHGVVALRTRGETPMALSLTGDVVIHPFHPVTTITLTLQGELLDSFVVEGGHFDHRTEVPAAFLAGRPTVDLGISTSTWLDGQYDKDCSRSPFTLHDLKWEAL